MIILTLMVPLEPFLVGLIFGGQQDISQKLRKRDIGKKHMQN